MEVYNECVYDLLVPPSEGHDKLQIQKRGKDVVVPVSGLSSEYCLVDTEDFYMLPISDFWPVVLLPYSRNLLWEKTFVNRGKKIFVENTFTKNATPPNFMEKTSTNGHKTLKFTKVFSLESFLLYGITSLIYGSHLFIITVGQRYFQRWSDIACSHT